MPAAASPPFWAEGRDRLGLVVEDEAQEVRVVDGEVEDRARSGGRVGQAPAVEMLGQVAGMDHARRQRAADPARGDQVADRPVRRGIAEVMVGRHHDAGLPAGRDHRPGIGEAGRERLLAEHVNAGFGGGDGLGAMPLVGGRDVDGVDTRGEEVLEVGHRERNAELLGIGLTPARVRAHHGDDVAARFPDRSDHPFPTDDRRTDQAPSNCRHHSRSAQTSRCVLRSQVRLLVVVAAHGEEA